MEAVWFVLTVYGAVTGVMFWGICIGLHCSDLRLRPIQAAKCALKWPALFFAPKVFLGGFDALVREAPKESK